MIDLVINSGDSYVYYSSKPIQVNRIGDVVTIPKEFLEKDLVNPRDPWNFLFRTNKLNNLGGIHVSSKFIFDDAIRFCTKKYDLNSLIYASKQVGSICILQGGTQFSLAHAINCGVIGYQQDCDELIIDFAVDRCEMIYDK